MDKFIIKPIMMPNYHSWDPYETAYVRGHELLVKVRYINCFGSTKYKYISMSKETDDYFIFSGTVKEEAIINHLKTRFLEERSRSLPERLFYKSQLVKNR